MSKIVLTLLSFTFTQLRFKRESHDGTVFYILLPIERLNDALKVLNLGFYPFENVAVCTEVAKNTKAMSELNELSKECIKDGVSIVAVEKASNSIIGVSINKIQTKPTYENEGSFFKKFLQTKCKEKESASLIQFMIESDSYTDPFERYNTNKLLEIMFLAVLPNYIKRGIGLELVRCDLDLVNELAVNFKGPDVSVAILTSKYSQSIGEKLQFDKLNMIPYSRFEYNNSKYSDKLDKIHTGAQVVGKQCQRRIESQQNTDGIISN